MKQNVLFGCIRTMSLKVAHNGGMCERSKNVYNLGGGGENCLSGSVSRDLRMVRAAKDKVSIKI